MTTEPTSMVRRYQTHPASIGGNWHVRDTTTGLVIETCSSEHAAEGLAASLNDVEMRANVYVARIMELIGEREVCGLCGMRYAAPGLTACSSCGGA